MHHHLDAYAYTNHLHRLFPAQKLLFALMVLLIALMAHPLTQGLIIGWLALWTVGYARIPANVYSRVFGVAASFFLISIPALVVEIIPQSERVREIEQSAGGLTIGQWYLFISHSGLIQTVEIGARSLSCISCLLFILFTVPISELIAVLRQCRIPSVLLDLLLLMYRFIFLFFDVMTQLQFAQQARGGYRTRQRWMYSAALLASQLLVRSLQRYQQFSMGLTARGFNGEFQVYSMRSYRYSRRYALEAGLGCLILISVESIRIESLL